MSALQKSPPGAWASLGIGAAAALAGLLPWLVHGMQLPLQNLGERMTGPADIVLLPFSQYALTLIAALLVVGAAAAGIASRSVRLRFGFVLLGMLAIQTIAITETTIVVRLILRPRTDSVVYLAFLVAVSALAMLIGVIVAVLTARAPRAGAVIGFAIAGVLASSWLSQLLVPLGSIDTPSPFVLFILRWIGPVLVGLAIAWAGIGSPGRIFADLAALIILWIGPALITGVQSAAGSRVLAHSIPDMFDYAQRVFTSAATMPELVVPPLLVAVGVAAVGLVVRAVAGRRQESISAD
jgi:hypothetical protein